MEKKPSGRRSCVEAYVREKVVAFLG